ncbi:hypothetical protein [Streptomyces sp. NBC_00316]|uniref:hypothetical protein n=1 Tax=Streptomyces sp. NBC_00316 TaxID=2975710 RepID=UPI002E2C1062|nr:hypothetical protein [Streptomyces sp. NBC_00316]
MSQAVEYECVVVGTGTSGSVPAARLREDSNAHVLLLKAGGSVVPPPRSGPPAGPRLPGATRNRGELTTAESRYRGIEGRRIAEPSAMPSTVSGTTNTTVGGLAEQAAEIFTRPGRW